MKRRILRNQRRANKMFYVPIDREPLRPLGGEEWGMTRLIRYMLENDQRFNANAAGIKASVRIEDALDSAKGRYVPIETNDGALLKQAFENPMPMPPLPGRMQMPPYPFVAKKALPFIEDVLNSKETKPEDFDIQTVSN
jgi:hypothetical protein